MIVTVTMNPAMDKTIEIDKLHPGGLNRIQRVELDVGGKGINVSKTIHALGGTTIATGFVGGNTGEIIKNTLADINVTTDFVEVEGEVRTNTKVLEHSGDVTELNEPGFTITEEKLQELYEKIASYTSKETLFVLAGSIPKGVPKDTYKKMIELIHEKGGKVLLDADGELFAHGLDAIPDMIKPNKYELLEYLDIHEKEVSDLELVKVTKTFMEKGISTIAISMGGDGAMMLQGDNQVRCPVLKVEAHSTVGAGDAMVAAMAYGWETNLGFEDMVRLSLATSAGAVTTIGTKPPSIEVVETLKKKVIINQIG